MKSLYLIRHGKSSWEDAKVRDFDRPLNEQGRRDAEYMAAFLKNQNVKPELFISSPAVRALTTCKYFAAAFEQPIEKITQEYNIYEAVPDDLYKIIQSIDNQHNTVLLFGHNPSISYLADHFLNDFLPEVATCGIVHLELNNEEWNSFSPLSAKFIAMWEPKKILSQNLV